MQSIGRKILFVTITILATFLVLELSMRVVGYESYQPMEFQMNTIHSDPEPLFVTDSLLGYRMEPGKYKIYYEDGSYWEATQDSNGNRLTLDPGKMHSPAQGVMDILGGSFTHGSGLSDEQTYPFRIQSQLPKYTVVNYAVGGYGIQHAYVQLRQISELDSTHVVVYAYMGEHDFRFSLNAQKKLYPSRETFKNMPFLTINEDFGLAWRSYSYEPWLGIRYSALINTLENMFLAKRDDLAAKHSFAKQILLKMNQHCQEQGAKFVFAGIGYDENTRDMLAFCEAEDIYHVDIAVNLMDSSYNLLPQDDHPNAAANAIYQKKLLDYLLGNNLVKDEKSVE